MSIELPTIVTPVKNVESIRQERASKGEVLQMQVLVEDGQVYVLMKNALIDNDLLQSIYLIKSYSSQKEKSHQYANEIFETYGYQIGLLN